MMLGNYPDNELFRCFICNKYYSMEKAKLVSIKGLILPKDVCEECWKKASEVQQTEKDIVEKKK